jgi:division protein CdvB (Snf7/Vps24/ESCRT-III family)
MGWFKRRADSREQLQELSSRMAAMAERLETADAAKTELDQQVVGLATRLDDKERAEELAEPPPPVATADEVAQVRVRLDDMVSRLDAVDQRLTSISTELANQISELSNDIESAGGSDAPDDELVGELRDAQARLANEQARYQIAFRRDLADLADRLRRG